MKEIDTSKHNYQYNIVSLLENLELSKEARHQCCRALVGKMRIMSTHGLLYCKLLEKFGETELLHRQLVLDLESLSGMKAEANHYDYIRGILCLIADLANRNSVLKSE